MLCDPVLSVDRPSSLEMDIEIDLSLKLCHISILICLSGCSKWTDSKTL